MIKKCGRCKEPKDVSNFYGRGKARTDWMSWCHACASAASKIRNRILKLAAFEHYGGPRCACCGETQDVFLALDHINNDGAAQRKKVGSGVAFYSWLRRVNYPKELNLQVLCHNCNIGKQINGICPHKILNQEVGESGLSRSVRNGELRQFESDLPDHREVA